MENQKTIYFIGDREKPNKFLGAKAENLNKLFKLDINIPSGFVILNNNSVTLKDIEKIGGFPVAVRSSHNIEDLKDASFAGLYETFLNVESMPDLKSAIDKCFQSADSKRVKNYLLKNNMKHSELFSEQMNVLVQKMIIPKYSGVSFSLNPVSGKEEESLIEVVAGLGERLVSGQVSPSRYIFENQKQEILTQEIGEDGVSLNQRQILQINDLLIHTKSYFKSPQDIEWVIDKNDKIWLLQSRPITTIFWRKDIPELSNADFKDGGVSSKACTPYMYSLYEKCLNLSMGEYFHKIGLINTKMTSGWIFYFYARVYWNATRVKSALKKIPGFDEKSFDEDMGIQKDYQGRLTRTPFSIWNILKIIPVALKLNKEYTSSLLSARNYMDSFEESDKYWKEYIHTMSKESDADFYIKFKEMIEQYYAITERNYFRTIYNNSNMQSDFKKYIDQLETKKNISIDHLALISNLGDIGHIKMQADLNALTKEYQEYGEESKQFQNLLTSFLSLHYHHADSELDILCPRWGEDPKIIIKKIKNSIVLNRPVSQLYKQELNNIKKFKLPRKFYSLLEKTRTFLKTREQMRELSTRAYFIVRKMSLELAKRFETEKLLLTSNDFFFLKISEVISFNSFGSVMGLASLAKPRKENYESFIDFTPPNEFGGMMNQVDDINDHSLLGIACSPGVIQGKAFVALTIEDTLNFNEGDILITKFTDPGWTPTMAKASAIATEVGGILSHAAVISREFGIPAVLNISRLTHKIQTGDTILVNGDLGHIERLDNE